ncbi:MAG: hypothetical protein MMC23_004227 [Stictis urceolatum]|nr:hypothetical protein [Stictis urceolata]
MTSSTKPIEIAVVGGGFAGLCLAIGLQKYPHINVHIYEAAHKFSEIGAGVVIGPNAQRAMFLIDPRILEGYERRAAFAVDPPDENGLYPWITVIKGQAPDIDEEVIQYKHKTKGSTIHRAHFLDELVKLIDPHRAHFGKRVAEVCDGEGDQSVTLKFSDGSEANADLVIGADGIHSAVRKHILGHDDPAASASFTGNIQYRAVVPIEEAQAKLGDIEQKVGTRCGRNGLVFGFPLSNASLYYLAVTTFNNGPWEHEKWIIPAEVDEVKSGFAEWDDFARKQVELLPNDGSTMGWSVWDMPPASTYFKGRVAIAGDAAHAASPFQGAGAGQAIEDALVLEKLIGKYLDPVVQSEKSLGNAVIIPLVLQAYDTTRRFRTQKVVISSREAGQLLSGNEIGLELYAANIRRRMEGRQNWIWDLDQEGQIKDAMLLFESARGAAAKAKAHAAT